MSSAIDLLRPEIQTLRPYRPADYVGGFVRLNANENPWRPPGDETSDGLNRYPEPRPQKLGQLLAAHYGLRPEQVLVTRGSSEAIDILVRGFCRAGMDEIIICPPTFGMYEVYAQIQGARVRQVPLLRDKGYALPVQAICDAWSATTKLVFVCSPNNPTGNRVPDEDLSSLCTRLAGRGIVVLDAAYAEFSGNDPTAPILARHENVVVLRTLSKALGLAGVRCGALLGRSRLIDLLGRILPPYCFPTTSQEAVLKCFTAESATELARRRQVIIAERIRLADALAALPGVRRVWPSEANFLLVEVRDAPGFIGAARKGGVLVRDFTWDPYLPDSVRITVGDPAENDQLLRALAALPG